MFTKENMKRIKSEYDTSAPGKFYNQQWYTIAAYEYLSDNTPDYELSTMENGQGDYACLIKFTDNEANFMNEYGLIFTEDQYGFCGSRLLNKSEYERVPGKIEYRDTIEVDNKLRIWLNKAVAKNDNRPSLTWAVTMPVLGNMALWASNAYTLHCDIDDYDDNCKVEMNKSINTDTCPPDLTSIVTRNYDYHVTVIVKNLMQGLKLFQKSMWEKVTLTFTDKSITLYSESVEYGDITHTIPIKHNVPISVQWTGNPRYLYNALSGFNKLDDITLHFNDYASPMCIGDFDKRFAVVMPVTK